ncbi:MAG: excinuclease ABC subunit C [Gammaproteobacteria bacterium]|nr:excinuclease ABC subunit C [Gammaproteobacteria bacterium]|tara:strand:+ start:2293 stop:4089 length:1797 start_codon:yes stop_codon:yes gene_type:complete
MSINLNNVPNTPGVYKFFKNKEIIYIGKAKNLKKRVSSYFGNSLKDRKTSQIKFLTDKVETFTTKNEVEALLLEQMLIKENKPKFNILLRDDKTYPYIYFSLDHTYPGVYLKRTKKAVDKNYFGPFVSSEAVKKSIKEIQKIFKIRNCSDNTFANRTRPCIEFQMKRCSAPCVQKVTKINYLEDIANAKLFLSSSDTKTIERLTKEIDDAVVKLDFEKASEIRDHLKRLNLIKEEQSVVTFANDIDIFSVSYEMNYIGISIIVVRNGKIRGTKTHLIKQSHFNSVDEAYNSAVFNFYDNQQDIPKKIILSHSLKEKSILEKMFQIKHQKMVKITHSPTKAIRPIFNLCKLNSLQIIQNHISKEDKYTFAFNELCDYIGQNNIEKIEAYDVSHIAGENGVASCVVFSKKGPSKKNYRLFNIPKNLSGNDVGSLKHVIERRLKYYKNPSIKPDLLLIDGGKNQLNFVQSALNESKHKNINVLSIVKGSNRLRASETIISKKGIIELNKYSKAFLVLQEIRDESHRFALQAQRKKKRKEITRSELDSIEGIGKIKKLRLLKGFKNINSIKSASIEELMTIDGINEKIAKTIKDYFDENSIN